jgi:hypothetical protein
MAKTTRQRTISTPSTIKLSAVKEIYRANRDALSAPLAKSIRLIKPTYHEDKDFFYIVVASSTPSAVTSKWMEMQLNEIIPDPDGQIYDSVPERTISKLPAQIVFSDTLFLNETEAHNAAKNMSFWSAACLTVATSFTETIGKDEYDLPIQERRWVVGGWVKTIQD